jgi:cold shock protein
LLSIIVSTPFAASTSRAVVKAGSDSACVCFTMYNSVVALATKSPIRITSPRIVTWEIEMARGTVKWFNPTKGYGFIQPQAGGKDVFVHISAVERAGLSTLNEGQHVEYEIEENRGKISAVNLKVK